MATLADPSQFVQCFRVWYPLKRLVGKKLQSEIRRISNVFQYNDWYFFFLSLALSPEAPRWKALCLMAHCHEIRSTFRGTMWRTHCLRRSRIWRCNSGSQSIIKLDKSPGCTITQSKKLTLSWRFVLTSVLSWGVVNLETFRCLLCHFVCHTEDADDSVQPDFHLDSCSDICNTVSWQIIQMLLQLKWEKNLHSLDLSTSLLLCKSSDVYL
jgi:hypothetical protein